MGRKRLKNPKRVDLFMETERVEQLDEMATKGNIEGGKSQLIRDAVDEKFGPLSEVVQDQKRPIAVNVQRAFDVIRLMEIACGDESHITTEVKMSNVAAVMDLPWSKMHTVMEMVRDFLEAKGWWAVLEPVDQEIRVPGRPGRPRVVHKGWNFHGGNRPFTSKGLQEARAQMTLEMETVGYIVRVPQELVGEVDVQETCEW